MGKKWLILAHYKPMASMSLKLGWTILMISFRCTSLKERYFQKSSFRRMKIYMSRCIFVKVYSAAMILHELID